jgi:hypothetical protein
MYTYTLIHKEWSQDTITVFTLLPASDQQVLSTKTAGYRLIVSVYPRLKAFLCVTIGDRYYM